jgi:oxygen-independent coproporphyrinogen-3 oxidase
MFSSNPPLGLYIHLPWCEKKCPYCDFNSYQAEAEIPEQAYVDALLNDLEQDLPLVWGRGIDSIFIGGGTPSLFSAAAIERLFSGLRALLNFAPAIEITLESNPGSADAENYAGYKTMPVIARPESTVFL